MTPWKTDHSAKLNRQRHDAGQASILLVLMLSQFLLAVLAFAVDYTNIWFQRQQVQTAADAACQAGAMDIYELVSGNVLAEHGLYTVGTGGTCSSYSSPGPIMCWYASKNGLNGYNGGDASVAWSFPASVTGITTPPSSVVSYPFLLVTVSLPVKTYFSTLPAAGASSQRVAASSTCGLTQIMQGAPIVVLNPTVSGALAYSGGASLTILGGPPRSIVVNSSSATAVDCESSGVIDTRRGGPNLSGSDVGVVGGPRTAPGPSGGCYGTNSNTGLTAGFSGGTNGSWISPSSPVADPFAAVPGASGMKSITPLTKSSNGYFIPAAAETDGCPDQSPTNYFGWGPPNYPLKGCKEYGPGYYPSGISESGSDVITFLPGVYYMDGDLAIGGSDSFRMAKPCANSQGAVSGTTYCSYLTKTAGPNGYGGGGPWTWHQTDGVMFYFHGTAKPVISGASRVRLLIHATGQSAGYGSDVRRKHSAVVPESG